MSVQQVFYLVIASLTGATQKQESLACASIVRYDKDYMKALELSKLPIETQGSLKAILRGVADVNQPFQDTDVKSIEGQPRYRFVSAILLKGEWFISFEGGGSNNVQTLSYTKQVDSTTGKESYIFWSPHNLRGPRCLAIKAMIDGIKAP